VGGAADYALSANGTLAYVPGGEDGSTGAATVVWVDRAGNVVGRAVGDVLDAPRDPRLSPDGGRLLLVTGGENDGDLWSYDLGGRPPLPLALPRDNRFRFGARWQASRVFSAAGGAPPARTAARCSAGSRRSASQVPRWSADGDLLLMWTVSNPDISAVRGDGTGEARPIVASEYREIDPALSPDGRWLAYVSDRTGSDEIWVQGYPDGVAARVSSAGGYEPQWSADGRELFFRAGDSMLAVAVETGAELSFAAPQRLFSGPYVRRPGLNSRAYAVARDGRFLMILDEQSAATESASIVVVQNFAEEIKRATRNGP
jgi:dipeptidyl aminopeptidase/acylaminoacyl peptidase